MPESRSWNGSLDMLGGRVRRSAVVNQGLVFVIILFGHAFELALGQFTFDPPRIGADILLIVATAVALALPWPKLPTVSVAVLPAFDILAITLLRESSAGAGYGVLWIIPAMWSAWTFGLAGALAASSTIAAVYWTSLAFGTGSVSATALLLPVSVAGAAAVTMFTAKRARRQNVLLARQETLLREVVNAVDFGMERIAADGTVALSNPARAAQIERAAQTSGRLYAADGITEHPPGGDPISRARAGELIERELMWIGGVGEDRVALSITARSPGDGHGAERIVTTQDVTNEVVALRAREDLVMSVSHELRTPLTSILGYIDLAADAPGLPEAAGRSLEVANRNAERLLALITDILAEGASSRVGVEIRIDPVVTDVADVVLAAVEAAAPPAQALGMTIDARRVEPAVAVVDPLRIRQVLDNLLSNAVKYGRSGGRIEVECGVDTGAVRVVVADDGPGIPPHEIPRIFDRFYRSTLVRGGSTHGNGIGLSITRDIVRAHAGDIAVESEEGVGTRFVVRLPLNPS